jgi:glycosyltransferase involved in cell wall biosynthesis
MKIFFARPTSLDIIGLTDSIYYPVCMARLGHDVSMLILDSKNPALRNNGVKYIFARNRLEWYRLLNQKVREIKPDIVHIYLHLGCGLYPFMFSDLSPRPRFVLDIRSPLLSTGLRRILTQAKNRLEILSYDGITAHGIESAWTMIGKRPNIHWSPPGVFLEEFPEKKHDPADFMNSSPVKMVYIGALNKSRKLEFLLQAVALASAKVSVTLDLYGAGDDDEALKKLTWELQLEKIVKFKGSLPRQQLFQEMLNYDIGLSYVPASILYDKAPPLKTLEYLALGLAVVATDTVGTRMIIEDGVNGLLAKESPSDYAAAIVHMVTNPALAYSMSIHARKSVASFDWLTVAKERLIPFYQSVLLG